MFSGGSIPKLLRHIEYICGHACQSPCNAGHKHLITCTKVS